MNLYEYTVPSYRIISILGVTALASALIFIIQRWQRYMTIKEMKKRHGCEEPPKYPHQDRWGSDIAQRRANAGKEGKYFQLYDELFTQLGSTYEETWRGKPLINTIDPVNVQSVAAVAVQDFIKDPERAGAASPFMGPSIFQDGPTWKPARSMIKPIFARGELSDLDHIEPYAQRFLDLIPDNAEVDLQPLLSRFSLDVTMGFVFGKSLGFLNDEIPKEGTELMAAFHNAMRWVIRRRESSWLQYRFYRLFPGKEFEAAYKKVHQYIDEQVARALREAEDTQLPKSDNVKKRKRYILLDEMAKEIKDPVLLRYHIIAPFIPGRDMLGHLIGNMLFQLARHPSWWARLRKTSLELVDTPLTFERLKSLADFRHVYQETFRLIGPSARVWRMAARDTVLPSGGGPDGKSPIFVAKGTPVVVGIRSMGHNKQTWGEDVNLFKPERWQHVRPMWDFIPFWGGPRICPAQQQLYTYSIYMLVKLTQRFESIENCDPCYEFLDRMTAIIESMNGIKVALKRPSGNA